MLKAIGMILRFWKYVPILFNLVASTTALVESVKAGDPGPEKKKAVMDGITAALPALAVEFGWTSPVTALIPVVSILIDLVVGIYNAIGFFKKGQELNAGTNAGAPVSTGSGAGGSGPLPDPSPFQPPGVMEGA